MAVQASVSDASSIDGRAEASIRTAEYAQLMAQGKNLEEEVFTRGQSQPECHDRPESVAHGS